MKYLSFEINGVASYGIVTEAGVVDLGKRFGDKYPTLKSVIEAGFPAEVSAAASDSADYSLDEISYLPTIPDATNIWCLALNYVEHHEEVERAGRVQELPKQPALFMRSIDSFTANGKPLMHPMVSEKYDYEGELGVVIGKAGRNISEADALDYVAGYTIINEGSVRDWQFHTKQITPGKNWYQSGAMGPWMVTADEIADPHNLGIKTVLNGETLQDGNSRDMVHNINKFISYLSSITQLRPGDVLSTGTPSGVGLARTPPLFMQVGDTCTVTIEGIGTLTNQVAAS